MLLAYVPPVVLTQPIASGPTDHPFLRFHSDCLTSPGHFPSFFRHSFNKQLFHACYVLSALLRSGGTTVKVVSRALAFMELKKSEQIDVWKGQ